MLINGDGGDDVVKPDVGEHLGQPDVCSQQAQLILGLVIFYLSLKLKKKKVKVHLLCLNAENQKWDWEHLS